MADVVQVNTFSPTLFPFNQAAIKYAMRDTLAIPWGQAVIDEAFEVASFGAGDTGTLVLDINLPANYCCLLRSIHLSAYDVHSIYWKGGSLGYAYQVPGGPYKDSMAALPEKDFLWWIFEVSAGIAQRNRSSVEHTIKQWSLGEVSNTIDAGTRSGPGSDNPMNVPLWISPNYPGADVVIYLESDTPASPVDFRLNAVFDLYDQQQAYAPEVMASPRRLAT